MCTNCTAVDRRVGHSHLMTTAGRTKAGAVARGTEGVRRVVNRLTIGSKE